MHPSLRQIGQLQAWRGRKGRDLAIAGVIEATAEQASRVQRRLGELIEIWREVLPRRIADRTSLVSLRSGVLAVEVDSASTAFEIDRLLRSGVETEIRRRFRGNFSRVRTRVATMDNEHSPNQRQQFDKSARNKRPPREGQKPRSEPRGQRRGGHG